MITCKHRMDLTDRATLEESGFAGGTEVFTLDAHTAGDRSRLGFLPPRERGAIGTRREVAIRVHSRARIGPDGTGQGIAVARGGLPAKVTGAQGVESRTHPTQDAQGGARRRLLAGAGFG